MKLTELHEQKIKDLTGFYLGEIASMTEGEFTRNIFRLYFKKILSDVQFNWLKAYRLSVYSKDGWVAEVSKLLDDHNKLDRT